MSAVEGDEGSVYLQGVQTMTYGPEDMAVAVIIPSTAAMIFRGQESDAMQLSEWTRRDIEVAKALLRDAMNRLDAVSQPYPIPALTPYPVRPAW